MPNRHQTRLSAALIALLIVLAIAAPPNRAEAGAAALAQGTSSLVPPAGTPAATESAIPEDPNAVLEVAISDEFSGDLIAQISIGTGGTQPSLYCAIQLENGEVTYRDFQQQFDQTPEFRFQMGNICSDRPLSVQDVYAISPRGDDWSVVLFILQVGDKTIYVAGLPQLAVLNPGLWQLGYKPQSVETRILIPPVTAPFFFRGLLQTGIVGGFQPNENVRAFTYTSALNADGDRVWNFAGGFAFTVNGAGYRLITVPDLQSRTLVLIGQNRSFVVQNALFEINGNRVNDPVAQADFYARVWADRVAAAPTLVGAPEVAPTLVGAPEVAPTLVSAPEVAPTLVGAPEIAPTLVGAPIQAPTLALPPSQPPPLTLPPTATQLAAGAERTDGRGIVQVYVPAGCFTMGSDALRDISGQIRGQTARQVCLTQPYWIDKYEVTNASWAQFVAEVGAFGQAVNFNASRNPDQPRVGMTRAQAEAYAVWRGGRIPTEAEWEYAARGPNNPLYPWGDTFAGQANIAGGVGQTVSVTSYPNGASWVGALNMAGNAGEWVTDCYSAAFDALLTRDNPVGPCDGRSEMVKGSSFAFNRFPAQVVYRFVNPPGRYWLDVGVRVVTAAQ